MKTKPRKYDYLGLRLYEQIELLATNGYSDKEIAFELNLSPKVFSNFKNERNKSGEPTDRSNQINGALSRGRMRVNAQIRMVYIKVMLGEWKLKTTVREKIIPIDDENAMKIITVEKETMPDLRALSLWLYNHDDEWRANILRNKREMKEFQGRCANYVSAKINIYKKQKDE